MYEEMELADGEEFSDGGFDLDYEFDAVRYFNFTRPESIEEASEAESWFESAGSYPPSPFIIKLNWREDIVVENASPSPKSKNCENQNSSRDDSDVGMGPEAFMLGENNTDDILKQRSRSRSSTLMKPTASVLAKQNHPRELYSTRFQRRFQNPLSKVSEKSSKNTPAVDRQETKRQKLETGYLRKVAFLKHQSLFAHKLPKKPGHLDHARLKVTVPKEPELETANRAHRHRRPKNNAGSGEHTISNAHPFKARPLNRKILEAPSLLIPKRRLPQLPEFQVFRLKTAERAMQHTSDNVANVRCYNALTQNESPRVYPHNDLMDERVHSVKAHFGNKKELKFPSDRRLAHHLPELLNKLSLTPEVQPKTVCQTKSLIPVKGSKENAPSAFHQGSEMINVGNEKPSRLGGKQIQCAVDPRMPSLGTRLNISRSLDIR